MLKFLDIYEEKNIFTPLVRRQIMTRFLGKSFLDGVTGFSELKKKDKWYFASWNVRNLALFSVDKANFLQIKG